MILWETKKIPKKVPPKYPQNPFFRALRALFSLFRALRGPFFTFSGPAVPFPQFFGPCGPFGPFFRALRCLLPYFSGPAGPLVQIFGPCGASVLARTPWLGPWVSKKKKAFKKKKVLGLRPDPEKKLLGNLFFTDLLQSKYTYGHIH